MNESESISQKYNYTEAQAAPQRVTNSQIPSTFFFFLVFPFSQKSLFLIPELPGVYSTYQANCNFPGL